MKLITAVLSLLLLSSMAHGEQVLREITWDKAKPSAGEVIAATKDTPFVQLKITNTESRPLTVRLATIEKPGITSTTYAVTGRARYEGVEGSGYLEMWSVFPNGGRAFTKTLGDGPLAPIAASSDWREFALPFSTQGTSMKPVALEINLVLPGKGTVYLGPLRLVESPEILAGMRSVWWNDPRFAWLGPAAGVLTLLFVIFAGITVWLVSKGKARGFVRAMWYVFLGIGIAYVILSRYAAAVGQPPFVHQPLLFAGIIFTVAAAAALILTHKLYVRWELRRMIAQDTDTSERRRQE